MDLPAALRYLDDHVNLEAATGRVPGAPTLERIRRLVELLGDPQRTYPVLHVTGTNGKGSTARILSRLLEAQGLVVGTYTSPHLARVNERITRNSEPIADDDLAAAIAEVASREPLSDTRPTYFEILTAAGLAWFADAPIDAAVVEVGLLGRWDATNVADGDVAVITNVALDHTDYAGPTRLDIAREKAGIIKPGATVVVGETEPELVQVFVGEAAAVGAEPLWRREIDFGCEANELAVGGRLLAIRTPGATYDDLFLPLHGAFQGDNAAVALTAAEAFFGRPLDAETVAAGFAEVAVPGRFEVVGRSPLVVLDGAHNPAGAEAAQAVLSDDFGVDPGDRVLVVGLLRGRESEAVLEALDAPSARAVVACTPDSPRAVPAAELADVARGLGAPDVVVSPRVEDALDTALALAGDDHAVFVTGSLYVVGAARRHLGVA